jgi:fructose-1,6-bisphosphatase/inositol monophosphatase family enzyme
MLHADVSKGVKAPYPEVLLGILETAEQAARAAGRLQLEAFRCGADVEEIRDHDLKLEIDRLSEDAIVRIVSADFPNHGILAEERGYRPGRSEYHWIIDPLDGSVNFHHGIPFFCVSLACYGPPPSSGASMPGVAASLGEPVAGVVFVPFFDEVFSGLRGGGATCNGRPITVGSEKTLKDAVIGISFGSREETMQRMCSMSAALVRDVRKLRMFGATALEMVYVACGRLSALVQGRVRPWDFAAARLILEESGGVFHAREIDPEGWEILASAPGLYRDLKGLLGPSSGV